jgi:5-oxopent-3-ene-1,2,5-tricarboxylate decarboxylase/2-hydroxyhepta-2,4-diene-1,7-dioate isomerase
MSFEFPFDKLPAIMSGPRRERRRALIGGSAFWGTLRDDGMLLLDDGRVIDATLASYLPPVSPSKIIAVHIAFRSRSIETRNKPKPTDTPTYFTKPLTALNGHGGQILKPADCKYLNYRG